MTGLAVFIALVALILIADRLTRHAQPSAPYLANAADLEAARPMSADERLAAWSAAYLGAGHYRNPSEDRLPYYVIPIPRQRSLVPVHPDMETFTCSAF